MNAAAKNIVIIAGMIAVVGAGAYLACRESVAGTSQVVTFIVVPLVICAAAGAWLLKQQEMLKPLLTFRPGDFTRGFMVAAILFGATFAVTHFVFPFGSDRSTWLLRVYLQLGDPKILRDQIPYVIASIAIASVAEEIVFRGVIPFLLEEHVGTRRAWLYSAVIYAVAMIPTAYALRTKEAGPNPLLPAAALACGLAWGQLTRRVGRLWPAIISHALFDWCVVMMFRLYGPSV